MSNEVVRLGFGGSMVRWFGGCSVNGLCFKVARFAFVWRQTRGIEGLCRRFLSVIVCYGDWFNVLVVPGWHTFEVMDVWSTCHLCKGLGSLRIAIR